MCDNVMTSDSVGHDSRWQADLAKVDHSVAGFQSGNAALVLVGQRPTEASYDKHAAGA